ncbi:hypothetical protein [Catellatospora methionotrophica]|uniref:hypothetical protein n=1 Tax=Catellatospora methionotrophica TaxID=121620 RepID=UPI0033E363F7
MTTDGLPPRRGRTRAVLGTVMWVLSVLLLVTAAAIIRDSGRWVVLLDHGSAIAIVLICLTGVLLAAAGPVFGLRTPRSRGVAYVAAACLTLCATCGWFVGEQAGELSSRATSVSLVAVSADGRFALVSRDSYLSDRDAMWLRSREGLWSRESEHAFACFTGYDGDSEQDPVEWAGFTGPNQVTVRLRDGRSGSVDFDGETLTVTGRQGGCGLPA